MSIPPAVPSSPAAAAAMFGEGYNCAQAVLATAGAARGLPRATAIKVAQAFGGGMGRTGNVCGAVTGALMAIGLQCSAKDGQDNAAKEKAHALTQEVLKRFQAKHGSLNCRDLIGCDLSTPEGRKEAVESGRHKTVCSVLVKDATLILEEVLAGAAGN